MLMLLLLLFAVRRIFRKSRKSMDSLNCCTHFGYVLAFHICHFRNFARTFLCVLYSLNCFHFRFDVRYARCVCVLHIPQTTPKTVYMQCIALQCGKEYILKYILSNLKPKYIHLIDNLCTIFVKILYFRLLHFMNFTSQKRENILFRFSNGNICTL